MGSRRETQERRDMNYNFRMNWWNTSGQPLTQEGCGCISSIVLMIGFIIILSIVIGLLDAIFNFLN